MISRLFFVTLAVFQLNNTTFFPRIEALARESPIVLNQGALPEETLEKLQAREGLTPLDKSYFPQAKDISPESPEISIYHLVPPEANQGWYLYLADISRAVCEHYHHKQHQALIMLEGKLIATFKIGDITSNVVLKPGQMLVLPPGVIHSNIPLGYARFLALDMPGYRFPEDVYCIKDLDEEYIRYQEENVKCPAFISDVPLFIDNKTQLDSELIETLNRLPKLDEQYYYAKNDKGDFIAHTLLPSAATSNKWSISMLEIKKSPKHMHKKTTERFIVLGGQLDIILDDKQYILEPGQSVQIPPGVVHHLQSANPDQAVRVLCISYPGFDPSDFYPIQ